MFPGGGGISARVRFLGFFVVIFCFSCGSPVWVFLPFASLPHPLWGWMRCVGNSVVQCVAKSGSYLYVATLSP